MPYFEDSCQTLEIKQADWQIALSLRVCPPDAVLLWEQSPELTRHIRSCPMCQHNKDVDIQHPWSWQDYVLKDQHDPRPAPGQVRQIRSELAGWGPKDRYYNPPDVIILEVIDDQAVMVAQIYPGDEFMTDGDVFLPEVGFAQPWNTYTVGIKDLERCQQTMSQDITQQILQQADVPFAADEDSFLFLFRCLETEVGSFFSQQSLAALLWAMETQPEQVDAEGVVNMLHQAGLEVGSSQSQDPWLELAKLDVTGLEQARVLYPQIPEQEVEIRIHSSTQKMAAAEQNLVPANMITADAGGISIQPGMVSILAQDRHYGTLYISGRVDPDFGFPSELCAWWESGPEVKSASSISLSADKQLFDLEFADLGRDEYLQGCLILLFWKNPGQGQ